MALIYIFHLSVVVFLGGSRKSLAADTKVWNKDNRFDNPRNWLESRIPCAKDRAIFPADMSIAVSMPETFSVSELILPLNGQFIFPKNGDSFLVEKDQGSSCNGKEVYFEPHLDSWYDPSNWNITSIRANPVTPSRQNAAVPHVFQVPCHTDTVLFPLTFKAQNINPIPTVAGLWINEKSYDQTEFRSLTTSETGKLLFPGNPPILITNTQCNDKSSCVCGNENVQNTICKFETPCPDVACLDPIQVSGHCCKMCASKITATYDHGIFDMSKLLEIHSSHHIKEIFKNVDSFVTVLSNNEIQCTYAEATDRGKTRVANQFAESIFQILRKDAALYGLESIRIEKSVTWMSGTSKYDAFSSKGLSKGAIAAIVIILIVAVGAVAAFYFYRRSQISGFSFARFDLRGDKIELELGTTPNDELEPNDGYSGKISPEGSGKSFDNPVYGENKEEVSKSIEGGASVQDFVENPMYNMFEEEPKENDNKDLM